MFILFVCMGNTYRSRLAEAYMKSLELPGVSVMSVGVEADKNLNGNITVYAKQLIHENKLDKYGKMTWTQLTQKSLDNADVVVCMNRLVYEAALHANYRFPLRTFIWGIADVNQIIRDFQYHEPSVPYIVHKTFADIIEKVQELTIYIRRPRSKEMVDIYSHDGSPTGSKTDIDSIYTKGLWHQGVHAAVITKDGQALFQKRANTIIGNPGLWDFTLGGIVAAGETPEAGLMRELKEEMGITVITSINKVFVYRYNHFLPHYGLHNRVFVHTYLIRLDHKVRLYLQSSEVADSKYLSMNEAKRFIKAGESKLGKMTGTYHYYDRLLQTSEQLISGARE